MIEGDIHWPDGSFWNVEAQMMSRFIPKDSGTVVDPASELTNEERVQVASSFNPNILNPLNSSCLPIEELGGPYGYLWLL